MTVSGSDIETFELHLWL